MKKAKAAVRYGMETLKLSPDELFKLIESSQGYDGDDYARWLASKIIEVAEEDGVQFSQLLVKKFNIVNDILEEVSDSQVIRDEFLDIFKGCLHSDLYSVDFEGIGEEVDVDWYRGVDFDNENSFFVNEKLPLEIKKKILENEKFSLMIRLSLDGADKKTDLYSEAKSQGLALHSKGAMMLYRLCNLVSAFDISNFKAGLLMPVKFLYEEENADIIDYFLDFFKIEEGYCMKSIEVVTNAFNSGDMAFITVSPRFDEEQDGVILTSISLDEDEVSGFAEYEDKRYSKSYSPMLNKISENSPKLVDTVPCITANGEVSMGAGVEDALGYLNINGTMRLSTVPLGNGVQSIAITNDNIKDIIAFYGVTVSKESEWGYSNEITCFIDGREGYEELLYNCLPLFLFDYKSEFKHYTGVELPDGETIDIVNKLDVMNSKVIESLLDVGQSYFSFEAKELYNICIDFIKYVKEDVGISGKTFNELRELGSNKDFNRLYEERLAVLKEYVNSLSRKYL